MWKHGLKLSCGVVNLDLVPLCRELKLMNYAEKRFSTVVTDERWNPSKPTVQGTINIIAIYKSNYKMESDQGIRCRPLGTMPEGAALEEILFY